MSYVADELVEVQEYKEDNSLKLFFIIISVILAAYFIGETLFGKNSLEVYLSLQKEKENFKKSIDIIEHENADLQKQYFELKSLMPKEDTE
jgi:cell division protein FtsB